jgi:hypothetical protein
MKPLTTQCTQWRTVKTAKSRSSAMALQRSLVRVDIVIPSGISQLLRTQAIFSSILVLISDIPA